jgi:hypothetical protein
MGMSRQKNHLCMRSSVPSRCTRRGLGYLIDNRSHTIVIHGVIPTTALAIEMGVKRRLTCLSFFPDKTRGGLKNSRRLIKKSIFLWCDASRLRRGKCARTVSVAGQFSSWPGPLNREDVALSRPFGAWVLSGANRSG